MSTKRIQGARSSAAAGTAARELIRRLLLHPRRRARSRRVGRLRRRAALGRAPEPRGAHRPEVRRHRAGRGGEGHGRRAARPAAQGQRDEDARAHGDAARASSISPATSACATRPRTSDTTAPITRAPTSSRTARSSTACPSSTARRSEGEVRRLARAASRRRSSSRSCRSPRRGCSRARSRSSASPAHRAAASRRAPGRTTPCARSTCARTSRSIISTSPRSCETLGDAGAKDSPSASCR